MSIVEQLSLVSIVEQLHREIGPLVDGDKPNGAPYMFVSMRGSAWTCVDLPTLYLNTPSTNPATHGYKIPPTRELLETLEFDSGAPSLRILVIFATTPPHSHLRFNDLLEEVFDSSIGEFCEAYEDGAPERVAERVGSWWWTVDAVFAYYVRGGDLKASSRRSGGLGLVHQCLAELERLVADSNNVHAETFTAVLAEYIRAH